MSGAYLRKWFLDEAGISREQLAANLGVSIGTLYNYFKRPKLDKRTILALAQLGCAEKAKELISSAMVSVG